MIASFFVSVPGSDSCPSSHPFAYLGGLYCCRYNRENSRPHLDANCNGEDLNKDSTCCYDDKYKKCQSSTGTCKDYTGQYL